MNSDYAQIDADDLIPEEWFRLLQQDTVCPTPGGQMSLHAMTVEQCQEAYDAILRALPGQAVEFLRNANPGPRCSAVEGATWETQFNILSAAEYSPESWSSSKPLMRALRSRLGDASASARPTDALPSGAVYVGRPVRAIRFHGHDLKSLDAFLPGSRSKLVYTHQENERGLRLAASVWTGRGEITLFEGHWLLTCGEDYGQTWTLDAGAFRTRYVRPGDDCDPDGAPAVFMRVFHTASEGPVNLL